MIEDGFIYLSIVIPAYNESKRLPCTLEKIFEYFKTKEYSYEVIVVDDGSTDKTSEYVKLHPKYSNRLSLLRSESNHGKGMSVRKGMLNAKGELVIFLDADGATEIEQVEKLIASINRGNDIAIGSRGLSESKVKDHISRRVLGWIFNKIVRILLVRSFNDTQCGFKIFKRSVSNEIFNKARINGFGFDVEILYLANKLGFKIEEVPVVWNSVEGSKIVVFIHAPMMFFEIIRVKLNDLFALYI